MIIEFATVSQFSILSKLIYNCDLVVKWFMIQLLCTNLNRRAISNDIKVQSAINCDWLLTPKRLNLIGSTAATRSDRKGSYLNSWEEQRQVTLYVKY